MPLVTKYSLGRYVPDDVRAALAAAEQTAITAWEAKHPKPVRIVDRGNWAHARRNVGDRAHHAAYRAWRIGGQPTIPVPQGAAEFLAAANTHREDPS